MDIRPNRLAAATETKTTTQTQQSQSDSSLLYRMAVRTMLEDLETAKNKAELVSPPAKLAPPGATGLSVPTIIPVPLPPAYLASSTKSTPLPTPSPASLIKATTPPPSPPLPAPTIKTDTAKVVTPASPILPAVSTTKTPIQKAKDDLAKIIEKIFAGKKLEKTTDETAAKKEIEIKSKEETVLKTTEEKQKEKEEEQKIKEENKKRKEAEALKIKEEKQKIKEEQKATQQATREEERKKREEEKIAKELAEKTAREIKLAKEIEEKEAAKKLQEEISQNLEKAKIDYEAGAYESVVELTQKILANESISWFLKLKVNGLAKDAASGLRKKQINQLKEATRIKDEENLKKIVASLPSSMPPITAPRTTSSPPPNLPTLSDSPEKIEDLISQPSPQTQQIKKEPMLKEPIPSIPAAKTISPLLTEIISENSLEPETEESNFNFTGLLQNKRILFIGASFLLVVALVGFGLWFANKDNGSSVVVSPSNTPIISATPIASKPALEPLIVTNKQKIITLKEGGLSLRESLMTLAKTEEPVGTFISLDIKDNAGKILSLKEISQDLNIEIFNTPTQDCGQNEEGCLGSKTLEDLIDLTKFSLFIYSQNSSSTNSTSPFITASTTNEGRLGLIISLKKQTNSTSTQSIESQLVNSLKDLETLLPKEFTSFLLKNYSAPQITAFSQASYKNAIIRYLNLPTSDIAIDYTIFDNKLIFATSKESMLTIIDQLAPDKQTGGNL